MIAIGLVMGVIGWVCIIAMSRANPLHWTKSRWSDVWTVMFYGGGLLVLIGGAKIIWNIAP